MTTDSHHDDFRPTASWKNLRLRAELLRRLREFFSGHGFLEVETPILSADTVVDRHLDPLPVSGDTPGPGRLWLQTSPEFSMKRLLAAGGEAIYQVTKAFRQGECGPLHNPEFTMVEWYRVGDGPAEGMELLGNLCHTLLDRGPAEIITYGEAFDRYVGIDPHSAGNDELAAVVQSRSVGVPESLGADDHDGWLDLLLVECVQPHLGIGRPTILCDYPAGQAALARIRPGEPSVAERFELFVSAVELANGYHELLDPVELRARNARNNALRLADGKPALPEQSRLLAAMDSGLPAATGVALGFDRLVMLAAGADHINQVIPFPIDRA